MLILTFCILANSQAGYQLLSVDGNSLKDVPHNEAVDLIRRSFGDRSKMTMEVVAIQA